MQVKIHEIGFIYCNFFYSLLGIETPPSEENIQIIGEIAISITPY